MSLASPTHLHSFLQSIGARPNKRLSQNFLIDQNILKKIVKTAAIEEHDAVLEIGSGPGALTEALLATKCSLTAVEKDPLFAQHLHRFSPLHVIEGDILDFDLSVLSKEKKTKVVANLPYSLTSPILGLLVPRHDLFSTLTLMVQEEVARRMVAKPSTPDYSGLTVFLQFYAQVEYAFKVSRRCFYPAPKVDSAVVTLQLLRREVPFSAESFFAVVKKAFGQRRKMLRSTLGEKAGAMGLKRPEELTLEEWITVHQSLS